MSVKNGGSAFPVVFQDSTSQYGMSLRDYFAAKAMQTMLRADSDNGRFRDTATTGRTAKLAYEMANAMLAEREKS